MLLMRTRMTKQLLIHEAHTWIAQMKRLTLAAH
jgi:hypothetical protein